MQKYAKQIMLKNVGLEGQQKIFSSKVLVVGMGGLGCPVTQYLISSGVQTLGIVDGDTVELSNISRQILFSEDDVGLKKVDVAKKRLRAISPDANIEAIPENLVLENAKTFIDSFDFVIDCTDNFQTKYLLNDVCLALNKTLITGSVTDQQGFMMVVRSSGPCLRCLYPDVKDADVKTCELSGVLAPIVGIVGSHLALETLNIILGSSVVEGVVIFDFQRLETKLFKLDKNANCSCSSSQSHLLMKNQTQISDLGNYVLVEVRQPQESSMNLLSLMPKMTISLDEVLSEENHLSCWDKTQKYLFYCRRGSRSYAAMKHLRSRGVTSVYSYSHGQGIIQD